MCRKTWAEAVLGTGIITTAVLGTAIITLAAVMLLTSRSAWAHTQTLPRCSSLPTADDFFGDDETAAISATVVADDAMQEGTTPDLMTRPGTGDSGEGNRRYRYAKITVPQLAAGELRVFSTDGAPADAILCHDSSSSPRARYQTSYDTAHSREEQAARTARADAQTAQTAAQAAQDHTNMSTAEDNARQALRAAATDLDNAASALETAGQGTRGTAEEPGTGAANTAREAAQTARDAADADETAENDNPADEITALYGDLAQMDPASGSAAGALITAAEALEGAVAADHAGFMLRATVNSGDGEYLLVLVQSDPATAEENVVPTTGPTLVVRFHGALSATLAEDRTGERIRADGDAQFHNLTVTAQAC